MTAARFFILSDRQEEPQVRALGLPVACLGLDAMAGFTCEGERIADDLAFAGTVGVIASGAAAASLSQAWTDRFGADMPEVLDAGADRDTALGWLVGRFAAQTVVQAGRNARLMRDLGQMRRMHDEMQGSFERLERVFYDTMRGKRQADFTLPPVVAQGALSLGDGDRITQRVPGASAGLSDLAIGLAEPLPTGGGVVSAVLRGFETGEVLATWDVTAEKLQDAVREGWLRLSLDRALGMDPISLHLSVEWRGDAPLRLAGSVRHPDPRFQAEGDAGNSGAVLAMRGWRYVPGASAALTVGAIAQQGGNGMLRHIAGADMRRALNPATMKMDVPFVEEVDGLMVHVPKEGVAGAILRSAAPAGARQVFCTIETRHEGAFPIEYAIALRDRAGRPAGAGHLGDFAAGLHSDWVQVDRMKPSQVHLFLDAPLTDDCDVYLMTRLPEGSRTDFGWSTFSDVRVRF